MVRTGELRSLSDGELLRRLSELSTQSRRVDSQLVAHIGEVGRLAKTSSPVPVAKLGPDRVAAATEAQL